jgi:hypothetical protein
MIQDPEDEAWDEAQKRIEMEQRLREKAKANPMDALYEAIRRDNRDRQVGIMLAMPMFGGMCHGDFALSMMRTVLLLTQLGYRVSTQAMFNESLITRARNNLAATFLADKSMDYLMFLDADIQFTEHDVLRLLLADREFCGGIYPRKAINWTGVAQAVRAGKDNPEDWSCSYLFNAVGMENGESDADGMIEVTHAATGFLLLKRSVFEKLIPHTQTYEDVVQGKPFVGHDFFRVGVGENGKYTSEDYWFSTSWRKIGGRIYLNPYLRLGHIGQHTFNGNLARMGTEAL